MASSPAQVVCAILAPNAIIAADLRRIADACAVESGQPVAFDVLPSFAGEPALTLRLPVELAASQHPVWCLACRLACFCPQARVSVLILGDAAFAPPPAHMRRGHSA